MNEKTYLVVPIFWKLHICYLLLIIGLITSINKYDLGQSLPIYMWKCACYSEQERAERERKGDLDQYERLDGNRNRTSESLAVKKVS